tara:strand:- start:9229 stop:9777 length:549 start_codon:yes stop_codon:yes gene_type:complete
MKKMIIAFTALLLVAMGSSAFADEQSSADPFNYSGMYMGGNVGYSWLNVGLLDTYGLTSNANIGLNIGYNFDRYFALEVDTMFGFPGNTEGAAGVVYGITPSFIARLPLGAEKKFAIYGKLGAAIQGAIGDGDADALGVWPLIGAGMAYGFNHHWSGYAEVDDATYLLVGVVSARFGVDYRF